jgi:hypothetical protein
MRAEADDVHRAKLVEIARSARMELDGLTSGRPDSEPVATNVATMRKFGLLIDALTKEVGLCGGEACFGRVKEGVVAWVVKDQLDVALARAESAEARIAELEVQLRFRDLSLF